MGCFLACFGSSKDRRRKCRKQQQHKKHNKVQPRYQRNAADQDLVPSVVSVEEQIGIPEKPVIISTVVEEEIQEEVEEEEKPLEEEEELTNGVLRKRVTFDSNVRTYEPVSVKESTEFLPQEEQPQSQSDASSEASSVTSSSTSYPSNHRYQNCRDSDDELDMEDQSDSDDSDSDDYENGELDYNDMYDDPSSRFASAASYEEGFEGRPNVRDRSGYVYPVLNPVENLSQWKAVKSKKSAQLKPSSDKENHDEQEPCFKVKKPNKEEELTVAVDASLSNWLSATSSLSSADCTTPLSDKQQPTTTTTITTTTATLSPPERSYSGSPMSFEDRPILGALTLEEIRQMSASNSPIRKSPGGHSPDDKPIIGSVGSYWSESDSSSKSGKLQKELSSAASSSFKGIPNTTSKYREDKRVNWHTTPFETRLERALKNGGRVGDAC